jgi:O-methyltransferase involved in polyketide biosynthesis
LFPYLDEAAAGAVVEQSARLAAPGSHLGADVVGRSMLESPWTRAYLAALARENSPWLFGTDDPEAFFGVHGWVATAFRPGDRVVSYGRWPYPVAPRGLPGIPQSFLITATSQDLGDHERHDTPTPRHHTRSDLALVCL